MVDAMEIVKEHVRRTVPLTVVPECVPDARAADIVTLDVQAVVRDHVKMDVAPSA